MRIRTEIHISRQPEDVFDFLTDFTNLTRWAQGVRQAQRLTQDLDDVVGAKYRITGGVVFYKLDNTYEVTACARPQRFAGRNEGLINFEEVYELTPRDGGTHISQTADVTLPGPAGLLTPIVRLMLGGQLAGDFKRLKKLLEEPARAT
jgi:carbon monoxide dehydrogenase subunit G